MKLPLLCCCLSLIAISPSATACGNHSHGGANALSQLGLTAAQKAQIAKIRHSAEPAKVKRSEILSVLTPAQLAGLKQLHTNHKV